MHLIYLLLSILLIFFLLVIVANDSFDVLRLLCIICYHSTNDWKIYDIGNISSTHIL